MTNRIKLGSLVLGNTYRSPALVAKMAAELDQASKGRFILGMGAGWFEREHQAYGWTFPSIKERQDRLEEACELVGPVAYEKGVALTFSVDGQLPPARADRDRVLQVLDNLLGNAIKFTPSGGGVHVGAAAGDHEIVVTVTDTGPGIPEEDRPHVFDRFWQVRRSDRAGAGLGLAIVRGIVEAHGGRAWVEGDPVGGSVFRFSLPTG